MCSFDARSRGQPNHSLQNLGKGMGKEKRDCLFPVLAQRAAYEVLAGRAHVGMDQRDPKK